MELNSIGVESKQTVRASACYKMDFDLRRKAIEHSVQ